MRVAIEQPFQSIRPYVIDEEHPEREALASMLLLDCNDQEESYLADIAKAEAGQPVLDNINHFLWLYLYPEVAVLEEYQEEYLRNPDAQGPPRCIFLPLAEVKALIHSWLEAKRLFYAQRAAGAG